MCVIWLIISTCSTLASQVQWATQLLGTKSEDLAEASWEASASCSIRWELPATYQANLGEVGGGFGCQRCTAYALRLANGTERTAAIAGTSSWCSRSLSWDSVKRHAFISIHKSYINSPHEELKNCWRVALLTVKLLLTLLHPSAFSSGNGENHLDWRSREVEGIH